LKIVTLKIAALSPLYKKLFYALLLTTAVVLSAVYFYQEQQNKAPNFALVDINDQLHKMSDYKGSTLIVNFWATWCAPCLEEIPAMNRAKAALADAKVEMIAINYGEDKKSVAEFLQHTPIDFTVLLDTANIASKAWNITVMPTTIIIDRKGNIIERILGPREWDSAAMIAKIKGVDSDTR